MGWTRGSFAIVEHWNYFLEGDVVRESDPEDDSSGRKYLTASSIILKFAINLIALL